MLPASTFPPAMHVSRRTPPVADLVFVRRLAKPSDEREKLGQIPRRPIRTLRFDRIRALGCCSISTAEGQSVQVWCWLLLSVSLIISVIAAGWGSVPARRIALGLHTIFAVCLGIQTHKLSLYHAPSHSLLALADSTNSCLRRPCRSRFSFGYGSFYSIAKRPIRRMLGKTPSPTCAPANRSGLSCLLLRRLRPCSSRAAHSHRSPCGR
jgi:hypothetical protein